MRQKNDRMLFAGHCGFTLIFSRLNWNPGIQFQFTSLTILLVVFCFSFVNAINCFQERCLSYIKLFFMKCHNSIYIFFLFVQLVVYITFRALVFGRLKEPTL
jgi:hypothetical protein